MQKPIVIQGKVLTLSGGLPATLIFTLTGSTDTAATRTSGRTGMSVLLQSLKVDVSASGTFAPGQTFAGTGSGVIVASTPRVECEGKKILTEGDNVSVTCSGNVTTTASGAQVTGSATVTVTISDGIQKTVDANKS